MTIQNPVSPRDTLDLLFAERNRAYGAYQLRRAYNRHLGRALVFGFGFLIFVFAVPSMLSAYHDNVTEPESGIYCPSAPPDIIPEIPKQKAVLPGRIVPPPARSTIAFVPPIVLQDEAVQDHDQNPISNILESSGDVGKKDVKGQDELPPSLPVPPTLIAAADLPTESEKICEMFDIQKEPSFPGGLQEMYKWLNANVVYPEMAKGAGISGQVVLSFVVGKDGTILDIKIMKDIGGGCGKSVATTLAKMPKWSPGEANGHPVKVRFSLPFKFTLE